MGETARQFNAASQYPPTDPRLRDALATLARIPAGRKIVRMLQGHDILLTRNDAYTGSATTFATVAQIEKGHVHYSHLGIHFGDLPQGNLIQALVHEATHIRQHIEQRGYPPIVAGDAAYTRHARALEAEAQATATDIAWKLKQAGVTSGAWDAVRQVGYADIADAYKQAARTGQDAKQAAQNAWYNNQARLSSYDADIKTHLIPYYRTLLTQNPDHGLSRIHKLDRRAGTKPAIKSKNQAKEQTQAQDLAGSLFTVFLYD